MKEDVQLCNLFDAIIESIQNSAKDFVRFMNGEGSIRITYLPQSEFGRKLQQNFSKNARRCEIVAPIVENGNLVLNRSTDPIDSTDPTNPSNVVTPSNSSVEVYENSFVRNTGSYNVGNDDYAEPSIYGVMDVYAIMIAFLIMVKVLRWYNREYEKEGFNIWNNCCSDCGHSCGSDFFDNRQ